MVSSEYPPRCGGSGIYTKEISERLVQNGYQVSVLTRGKRLGLTLHVENGVNIYRICCPPLYPFHVDLHKLFVTNIFKKLENDCDVVHFHSPLVPLLKTKRYKIATIHGTVLGGNSALQPTDLPSIFTKIFTEKFIKIEKDIIKESDMLMPISEDCKNDLISNYNITNKPMLIVGNGVDTSFFRPIKLVERDPNLIKILYVGRINSQKGLKDIVKCVKYLVENGKVKIECTMVGNGPFKSSLIKYIYGLKLQQYFKFVSYIESKEILREYYRAADVFVLPSYYEGSPTVLLEAMSCGIPGIATNVGGIPELIQHGKNGLIIPSRDPVGMAHAILKLVNDESLRTMMGINAIHYIKEYHDWSVIVNKLEAIYENVSI